MIVVRAPFRLPLGGGGTDLPSYYQKYEGFLITAAINKYMFININEPAIVNKIKVNYSKVEIVELDEVKNLKHEIVRESLNYLKIKRPLEISSMADLSAGTGMGSSSSYTVGLLQGLNTLLRRHISLKELAEEACKVEIELIGKPIGKQDQYAAAFGGIIQLDIDRLGNVVVTPLTLDNEIIYELENRLMMFYTNIERDANEILDEQSRKISMEDEVRGRERAGVGDKESLRQGEKWSNGEMEKENRKQKLEVRSQKSVGSREVACEQSTVKSEQERTESMGHGAEGNTVVAMHRIKEIGYEVKEALTKGDVCGFGKLLNEHWLVKKSVSNKMSNSQIDNWYELAMKNGALGGKVMGAGGGGFMLFCVSNGKRKHLRKTLEEAGLKYMDFKFDWEGVKTLVNI
jgi:D-glycero-alpha-D-manno-heptose-7-phosphate kinase